MDFGLTYIPRTKKEIINRAKEIEDFLGPLVNYNSGNPHNQIYQWLLEYTYLLKKEYYKRCKKRKKVYK